MPFINAYISLRYLFLILYQPLKTPHFQAAPNYLTYLFQSRLQALGTVLLAIVIL